MSLAALVGGLLAAALVHAPDSARAAPTSVSRPRAAARPAALAADSVVVEKGAHRLTLYYRGSPVRSYRIALGGNPRGTKQRIGDRRTPEGLYHIDWRNPESRFHLSLHISYPDDADRARAARSGVSPGGAIMIHGLPRGYEDVGAAHSEVDWTDGCVAVTNEEVEEIWRAVPLGAPIQIKP